MSCFHTLEALVWFIRMEGTDQRWSEDRQRWRGFHFFLVSRIIWLGSKEPNDAAHDFTILIQLHGRLLRLVYIYFPVNYFIHPLCWSIQKQKKNIFWCQSVAVGLTQNLGLRVCLSVCVFVKFISDACVCLYWKMQISSLCVSVCLNVSVWKLHLYSLWRICVFMFVCVRACVHVCVKNKCRFVCWSHVWVTRRIHAHFSH